MMASFRVTDPRSGLSREDVESHLACFQRKFPGKRLLALQLDGFSHGIVYDDVPKTKKAHFAEASFCCSESEWLGYCRSDEERAIAKAARDFFIEIGFASHIRYQNNPLELIYVSPEER